MKIDDIIPYERNARNNKKAIPVVAESIKEFGLRGQIVLESRENPVIVTGHTRWAACKSLGWQEIPDEKIDFAEDLTEEQIKAYRLADNKTGQISTWNKTLLRYEVNSLKGFNMKRLNFDFKSKNKAFGAERLKTDEAYNLHLVNIEHCTSSEFPDIEPCDYIPKELTGFNYALSDQSPSGALHFFIDDYQFERLWRSPEKYLDTIKKYEAVLTPDFSLYMDMPLPMQRWNIYRSRALGNYWQKNGIKVIPTLSWSGVESFEFCFKGLPKNSVYAVSTVGAMNNLPVFYQGLYKAIDILKPKHLLIYGSKIEVNCKAIFYKNKVPELIKEKGK